MSCVIPHYVAHNVHLLNLPAPTTHLLQVADIAVFGPFKKHLTAALTVWQHEHDPRIGPTQMGAASRPACEKATRLANCIAGFEKAGIWPLNPNKITPEMDKEGVRLRGLSDDSSRYAPPPISPIRLECRLTSPPVSSCPGVLESVSSILSPPPRIPCPPPPAPDTSRC